MNTKNLFLVPVLNLSSAGRLTAQTFATLHSFAARLHRLHVAIHYEPFSARDLDH
jgi:hypothetical protein